jgi:hypothetical protein
LVRRTSCRTRHRAQDNSDAHGGPTPKPTNSAWYSQVITLSPSKPPQSTWSAVKATGRSDIQRS